MEAIVSTHKVGTAIITAEAQDESGISATCEVEVTQLQVSDIELITMSAIKTIPTLLEANVLPVEANNKKTDVDELDTKYCYHYRGRNDYGSEDGHCSSESYDNGWLQYLEDI